MKTGNFALHDDNRCVCVDILSDDGEKLAKTCIMAISTNSIEFISSDKRLRRQIIDFASSLAVELRSKCVIACDDGMLRFMRPRIERVLKLRGGETNG